MFMDFAVEVLLLLSLNANDVSEVKEFQIDRCLAMFSRDY
jgi:hypothetical protein